MRGWKRGAAVLLALSLCFGCVPVDAAWFVPQTAEAGTASVEFGTAADRGVAADGLNAQDIGAGDGALVGGEDAAGAAGSRKADAEDAAGADGEDAAGVADSWETDVKNAADADGEGAAGASGSGETNVKDAAGADGDGAGSEVDGEISPGTGEVSGLPVSEDGMRASGATGSPIEESFIAMTEGQMLHQRVKEKQYYVFAPTQSGWYHLVMESRKDGDFFAAGVYETIYYEGDVQKKKVFREDLYRVGNSSASDYVMWLNRDEKYVFHCSITGYKDSTDLDVALTMKKADILGFEVVNGPAEPSDFGFVGRGMQVKVLYSDGTSFTEPVKCMISSYEGGGSVSNELELLDWNDIAVARGESISKSLDVLALDGNRELTGVEGLSEGNHSAVLGVRHGAAGVYSYFEMETQFEVSHNPIVSISVLACRDTYEQGMEQYLGNIRIRAVHQDGTEEEFHSGNTYIYQSLPCDRPEDGPVEYAQTSIDSYLMEGGSLGEAVVTVRYRGKETSYPIRINEYPYNGMSVNPSKTVYYIHAGYVDTEHNHSYSGEMITKNDLRNLSMSRKDGEPDQYYYSYQNSFADLPYEYRLKYGIEWNGQSYKDVDAYIAAGGSAGSRQVTVSYQDFTASYTVDIRQNPYVRMEIEKLPDDLVYEYNSSRIDLSGLVIRAYKNETEYDTYTYGQKAPEGAAVSAWQQYFRCFPTLEGYYPLSPGEHTVYLTFLNMRAEFKIRVNDRPERPEEPEFTEMKILKKPARTLYYVNENQHLNDCLTAEGLELELTDSRGNVKKYKYQDYSEGEFASWSEISDYISFEWKRIDWSAPGTYPVSVFCQKTCAEFDVTIADSPVESFEILRMPETDTYYFYENKTVSSPGILRGLAYRITFDDGSVYAETIRSEYGDDGFTVSFRGRNYKIKRAWLRSTSSGTASAGENAVVFTLFGKQYRTGPIMILDSPVESLEVIKEPDDVLCIGQNPTPDLYGARFKITYTDKRTREVTVREHTASVPVEEDGSFITAQFFTEWQPGDTMGTGFFLRYIEAVYYNCSARISADIKPQELQPAVLQNNGQASGVLDAEHPYQVFSFTPEEEGTYSFFCVEQVYRYSGSNSDFYVSLYDGDQSLVETNAGGWEHPFQTAGSLRPGHTYYYIVSKKSGETRERIPYTCYLSSEILNAQQLGSPSVGVVDTEKKTWYEFELANQNWVRPDLRGTTFRYTYANGWTEEKYISEYTYSIFVDGKSYTVDWKYLDTEEPWAQKPQLRDDNALVFTYMTSGSTGDPNSQVIKEIPIRLNVSNPVESIQISSNPFEGLYEYQMASGNPAGLAVTVHFKGEGRPDETVVWDGSPTQEIDGGILTYDSVTPTGQTGENGGRIYRLKVSCTGLSDEVLFEVLPNSVTGFELVKQPQKRTCYPFEQIGDLDLYGMEYTVVFRDGTKETVAVKEHGSVPQTPEGSEEIQVSYKDSEREDGTAVTEVSFSYRGYKQKVTEFERLPFPSDQAAELSAVRENEMVLGYEGRYRIYQFTAQGTNRYQLDVSGNLNFEIGRYDKDGEWVDSESARKSGRTHYQADMEWDMNAGDTVYLVFHSRQISDIGSLCASLAGETIEKTELEAISLTVQAPVAGTPLPFVGGAPEEGYRTETIQWYGDADEDGLADFATAHRLMLILAPEPRYCFTEQTKVTLNGREITDRMIGADGRLTLYDTFPYTDCKITLPQTEGYTLDTDGNAQADRVVYGGTYRFRYLKEAGSDDETLSVKANGNVVEPDAEGYYTLTDVKENISVTVRRDISDITPGEDESKITMHNKSEARFDVMLGKKGHSIKDNPEGENSLPLLPSYENGSDDFFYGWYLDKNEAFNGTGTRFTSMTNLSEDAYELFSKWGSGIFEQRQGTRNAVYRVLSFDEYNQMKVEIKGIRRYELRTQADGANIARTAGFARNTAADDGRLEIPAVLSRDQMQMQEGLELEIEGCEVIAVADNAFKEEPELTAVVLPETVQQIGAGAFENCTALTEVNLPDGIAEIGDRAFAGCDSLKKIVLPGTLQLTGDELFAGCSGISVVLPDTIEEINSGAFAGAEDLTVICSSKLKENGILEEIQQEGVTVQTIDLVFGYENGEKTFSYGAGEELLTVNVFVNGEEAAESRPLIWQYEETDAYSYRTEGNALAVTPNRLTTAEDEIRVTAIDAETNAQASLILRTVPADLGQKTEDGEAVFDVQVSGSPVYNGSNQCPDVIVYRRGGGRLEPFCYEVSYADNLNAGTGRVTVTGTGNYTGSITKEFEIGKAEQVVIAFDLEKTTDDLIFPLNAKASGNGTLHYSSSNPAVAVVDGHGIVLIRGAGTTELGIWASETDNYRDSALKTVKLVVKQAGILPPGTEEAPDQNPDQNQPDGNVPPQTGTEGTQPDTNGGGTGTTGVTVAKTSFTKALGSKPFSIGALAAEPIRYVSSSPKVASVNAAGKVTLHRCGTAVITVTAGSAQARVVIRVVPKKAKAKAESKKSGELSVSWNRQKEASGYMVEYSTDRKFRKNTERKVLKGNRSVRITLKKLKSGKKYYVRVKAYTVIAGKKVYGTASKAVRVKVKG